MVNCKKVVSSILFAVLASVGYAADDETVEDWSRNGGSFGNVVVSLSLGYPSYSRNGINQTIVTNPGVTDVFQHINNTQSLFASEFFIGIQRPILAQSFIQLGGALASSKVAGVSGDIYQTNNQQSSIYQYNYKIKHVHAAFKAKLLSEVGYYGLWFYESASLGLAGNNSYGFMSGRLSGNGTSPYFTENSTSSFTYTIGVGLQKVMTENWQIGVGYDFADWGKSNLGPASGQTTDARVSFGHFYTNTVLFNLTYVC